MEFPRRAAKRIWVLAFVFATLARAEQPLPTYPGTVHTRIGTTLYIAGEPHRLAYFTTDDPMVKVAHYFRDHWRREGYPVTVDGDFRSEGVVSAFFTREGLQRSVVLRRHQDKTVGFAVLKDLWTRQSVSSPAPLPPVEGAVFTQDLHAREGGWVQRSTLVEAGLDAARARVGQRLTEAGWTLKQEAAPDGKRGAQALTYARGAEQLAVSFSAVQPALTAVSMVFSTGAP